METRIALWIKIAYTLFVCWLIPLYWKQYGPSNFLWFSDIALMLLVPGLWLESKLIISAMAVSVLLLEVVWNVDFLIRLMTGKRLVGLSTYMFDPTISLSIRALSLFHVLLPVLLLWYVYRLGYDDRALVVQTLLAWIILPVSYLFTSPEDNINWVYGFGEKPQTRLPALLYLVLLMLGFPLIVYLPTHFVLKKLFG
jgi:hypothetical protein